MKSLLNAPFSTALNLCILKADVWVGFQVLARTPLGKEEANDYFFALQERLEGICTLAVQSYTDLEEMRANVMYACLSLLADNMMGKQSFLFSEKEYKSILRAIGYKRR